MVRGSGPLRSMSGLGVGNLDFNSAHPYAQGWWGGGGEGAEAPLRIGMGIDFGRLRVSFGGFERCAHVICSSSRAVCVLRVFRAFFARS